jgi:hypothetical protein
MNQDERNARWQQILEARADFADQPGLRPVGRNGGRGRGSRTAAQFNEALSGLGSWSSIQPRRRRMSA